VLRHGMSRARQTVCLHGARPARDTISKSRQSTGIALARMETLCRPWPGITRDIKWGDNLVFSVGGNMFMMTDADGRDGGRLAFRVAEDCFLELTDQPGVIPAPIWRVQVESASLHHAVAVRSICRRWCAMPVPWCARSCRERFRPNSAAPHLEGHLMTQYLGALALLVADYDEAIAWYTNALGFELVEDTDMGGNKRWVLLAPPGSDETRLLLARAANDEQRSRIGNQAGGRVFLLLNTDDFQRDWQRMRAAGVRFREEPRHESYGTVAVFEDLYGNGWDLLQLAR
jgi:catechol 2,3-dioxygenase-like lactoylglutathione lyase family enzyme